MTRREALQQILLGTVAAPLLGSWPGIAAAARLPVSGTLSFHNLHTGESAAVRYLDAGGATLPEGLARLDHLCRCHFADEVHPIAPELYRLLDSVRCRLGAEDRPFQLVSGYRSPAYNALLRKKSPNVARRSYHLQGLATDVRLDGVAVAELRKVARELSPGGVGRYREFVHLDLGPNRSW